jgi:hypothetical protein
MFYNWQKIFFENGTAAFERLPSRSRVSVGDKRVAKLEGHYIRGTALLDDNADNPVRNDNGWFMLMLKTTVSF